MNHSHIPFGLMPPHLLPGWWFPGAGGFLLYRGGESDGIDYRGPVGFAAADARSIRTSHDSLVPLRRYCFGLRRVSDAGVEEHNTHVRCTVVRPAVAARFEHVLPRPVRLQYVWRQGQVRLTWQVERLPGSARPDSFEILRLSSAGAAEILAQVSARVLPAAVFSWTGAIPAPATVAVRSKRGEQVSSLSAALSVAAASVPQPPQVL